MHVTAAYMIVMALEVATLLYHEVTDDPRASGFQRRSAMPYKLCRRAFAEHLDAIADGAHPPTRVTEIDFSAAARHLMLSFDDGGASALGASDMLAERGWKAHFLVTTGKLGSRTFLDAADVRALHAAGHVVGTHSHTHPNVFRALSPVAMLREWRESRDRLEQILGHEVTVASVPGGDSSIAVECSAAAAGLRWLFTSVPELRPRRVGTCWVLGRACAKNSIPVETVRALASFRGWRRARIERQLKDVVRVALDPAYRLWVRSREAETE